MSDTLKEYMTLIKQYPLLSEEEEQDLAVKIMEGDEEAKMKLVRSNLRLVVKLAHHFKGMGLSLLDLISVGNIGLMHASRNFLPNKSCFATFAQYYIRAYMRKEITRMSGAITMPPSAYCKRKKILEVKESLGENCTVEEITKECGRKSVENVRDFLNCSNVKVSLNEYVDDDGKKTYLDMLEQDNEENAADALTHEETLDIMIGKLDTLTEREFFIIERLYGLNDKEKMTLRDIGEALHLSAERIRQIEKEVLVKLRTAIENHNNEENEK